MSDTGGVAMLGVLLSGWLTFVLYRYDVSDQVCAGCDSQ